MFDEKNRYVIQDYQAKPTFSSFLPGIAGPIGVPVWCYYNNRGQGVCSFGAKDKDHAIMEFSPARTACREVSRTGFRTFCKVDGAYRELFTQNCAMHIGMSELEITCRDGELEASAAYFGLPGERTAALARTLTVRNAGDAPIDLELLDGMPELVPYGVDQDALKNMANLAQAWMRVEDADAGRAPGDGEPLPLLLPAQAGAAGPRRGGANLLPLWPGGGQGAGGKAGEPRPQRCMVRCKARGGRPAG